MWIGLAGERTGVHSHHAVQVTLVLSGEIRFKSMGAEWSSYAGAAVMPHHRHAFCGKGILIAHICRAGIPVGAGSAVPTRDAPIAPIPEESLIDVGSLLKGAYEAASDDALRKAAEEVVVHLTQGQFADPRILRSLAHVERLMSQQVKLNDVADAARSPGQLFVAPTEPQLQSLIVGLLLQLVNHANAIQASVVHIDAVAVPS